MYCILLAWLILQSGLSTDESFRRLSRGHKDINGVQPGVASPGKGMENLGGVKLALVLVSAGDGRPCHQCGTLQALSSAQMILKYQNLKIVGCLRICRIKLSELLSFMSELTSRASNRDVTASSRERAASMVCSC